MNIHHKRAIGLFAGVASADAILGWLIGLSESVPTWHGLYCSVGLTTTDGCDLTFHGWRAYTLATIAMVFMVPLWTAIFSLFATGLVADHVDRSRQ